VENLRFIDAARILEEIVRIGGDAVEPSARRA
jgi:hypothetical protein